MTATLTRSPWDEWLDGVATSLIELAERYDAGPENVVEYCKGLLTDCDMPLDKAILLRIQSRLGQG